MDTTDGATDSAQQGADTTGAGNRAADRTTEAVRKMEESRQTMKRLAGEIADTEIHLATTLRQAAAAATQQGRSADAERLIGEAEQAESYAEVERRRAAED